MTKLFTVLMVLSLYSCVQEDKKSLPILGRRTVDIKVVNGEEIVDTIYQKVPAFSFTNQDGKEITNEFCKGKIYTADFFFTFCSSICPVTKRNMLELQEAFQDDDRIAFLSHSLAPDHDTPEVLKDYADKLGANTATGQWQFLTGTEEKIYEMAVQSYFIAALKDSTAPDGIDHSGKIILVDTKGRMRGYYEGTDKKEIERLIEEAKELMDEEF